MNKLKYNVERKNTSPTMGLLEETRGREKEEENDRE
jgi:hypothetical protein